MSVTALHLREPLTEAPDDRARARILAEEHCPQLRDVTIQGQLCETELRLQKEIREVEARLQREIRGVELKVVETKAELIRWVVGVGLLQTSLTTDISLKLAHLI